MNKSELINEVSKLSTLSKKDCENCLNAITSLVSNALKRGDAITIAGFGKFMVKYKAPRKNYNPKMKKNVVIPAHKTPVFKAGKNFKKAICE